MTAMRSQRGLRRRRVSRPIRADGFTIVELLFAIGVLTVALLGMVTVLLIGHADISQSGRDTQAAMAVQSLIEGVWSLDAKLIPNLDGMTSNAGACPGAAGSQVNILCTNWSGQVSALPQGQGVVTVATVPNTIAFYQVIVNVNWSEAGRGGRQLTMVAGRSL